MDGLRWQRHDRKHTWVGLAIRDIIDRSKLLCWPKLGSEIDQKVLILSGNYRAGTSFLPRQCHSTSSGKNESGTSVQMPTFSMRIWYCTFLVDLWYWRKAQKKYSRVCSFPFYFYYLMIIKSNYLLYCLNQKYYRISTYYEKAACESIREYLCIVKVLGAPW